VTAVNIGRLLAVVLDGLLNRSLATTPNHDRKSNSGSFTPRCEPSLILRSGSLRGPADHLAEKKSAPVFAPRHTRRNDASIVGLFGDGIPCLHARVRPQCHRGDWPQSTIVLALMPAGQL
jgi:hypothetical protein